MSNSHVHAARQWRRYVPQVLAAITVAALLAWIAAGIWWDTPRAWAMLLTDFLFLSSLSAGLVVWPAIVVVSRGNWMGSTQRTALAGVVLLPVCVLMLLVLILGARYWAPWLGHSLPNSWWLDARFLFPRDVIALIGFSGLAWWFARDMKRGRQPRKLAAWLILAYAIAFSILGIDLGMALDPHWYSQAFGVYFFISGLYIAMAGWMFMTAVADETAKPGHLQDQAKLLIAFSMLTAYLMYSQLLPIWYENMPHETRFLVPRMNAVTRWPVISTVLLGVVYLGPLALLLPRRAKRNAPYVGIVAALVLAGMWVERWWLVMPSLGKPLGFGLAEIAGVLALAAGGLLFVRWASHIRHESQLQSA